MREYYARQMYVASDCERNHTYGYFRFQNLDGSRLRKDTENA